MGTHFSGGNKFFTKKSSIVVFYYYENFMSGYTFFRGGQIFHQEKFQGVHIYQKKSSGGNLLRGDRICGDRSPMPDALGRGCPAERGKCPAFLGTLSC